MHFSFMECLLQSNSDLFLINITHLWAYLLFELRNNKIFKLSIKVFYEVKCVIMNICFFFLSVIINFLTRLIDRKSCIIFCVFSKHKNGQVCLLLIYLNAVQNQSSCGLLFKTLCSFNTWKTYLFLIKVGYNMFFNSIYL